MTQITSIEFEAMRPLEDEQGLIDCFSAHTLIAVGEIDEAIAFCNSILRQPAKNLMTLQTQAYLTMVLACIDEKADKDIQLKKARKLWQRVKKEHESAGGTIGAAGEMLRKSPGQRSNEQKWLSLMDSLDEAEKSFVTQINNAKEPLQARIEVLEKELAVSQGKVTLLQDQSAYRQDIIDILQAEIAIIKSNAVPGDTARTSGYPVAKKSKPASWMPFPLSLCFGGASDQADESDEKAHASDPRDNVRFHQPSMIFDNKLRYSTSTYQTMAAQQETSPNSDQAETAVASSSSSPPLSDIERLMMNGPILVRPGRPLAYVDDTGHIVEVDVDIKDLPPTMFPSQTLPSAPSNASLAYGRPRTIGF